MGREAGKGPSHGIEQWEWKIVKELVRQARSEDPDYLETELLLKLAGLKTRRNRVRSWKNYLWTALRNHALNLTMRSRRPKTVPIGPTDSFNPEDFSREFYPAAMPEDQDRKLALEAALKEFSPRLRLLWETLKVCDGSQLAAAKRLRKHPNTILNWIRQMRRVLTRHGFS